MRRPARRSRPAVFVFLGALLSASLVGAGEPRRLNGFVLEPAGVPVEEILDGGPGRDGIPALDDPPLADGDPPWSDDERVIGVLVGDEARAYPISILVWHELVNDRVGGTDILVSFCPLCGTGIVFDRRVDGESRRFGVSGLLYRSDLLMYDRETESLWSQIAARAITGSARGKRLTLMRSTMTTWGEWRRLHPRASVLGTDTGHVRPYDRSPYGDYASSERLLFPVRFARLHPAKMPTLGLRLADGRARAYPAAVLEARGGSVRERFGGFEVSVAWNARTRSFQVEAPEPVEVIEGYWFAWASFHPRTSVLGEAD